MAEQTPASVALPGWELVLVTGITALLIAATGFVSRGTWSRRVLFAAHVLNTIVHEAGHAASAVVTGGGVYRIKATSPDGDHTIPWLPSWFSSVVATFAGVCRALVAYTEAWLLLLCEFAGVWVLVKARIRGRESGSDDATVLARKTFLPSPVWILAWLALNGWALWVAVPLLWP